MIRRVTGTRERRPSGARGQSLKTYPHGRVCGASGCATVLSTYNPSSFCALHECAVRPPRRVRQPVAERTCEHCRAAFETANPHRRFCDDRCRVAAFAGRMRSAPQLDGAG